LHIKNKWISSLLFLSLAFFAISGALYVEYCVYAPVVERPEQKFERLCKEIRMRESTDGKYTRGRIVNGRYYVGRGKCRGPWQFRQDTFEYYKWLFKMPNLQWLNSDDQDLLARLMIRKGHGWNWITYKSSVKAVYGSVNVLRAPFPLTRALMKRK
jgi:hypothetical protein